LRILIVHNHYGRFAQGGEANVVNAEAKLLAEHGHEVMKYERTNAEIYEDGSLRDKLRAFRDVTWSEKSYREIKKVIQEFMPDIMHVHNYWLVLSPSIFAAAKSLGVKTVFTLHNYRLICPGNQLLRGGKVCELCLHQSPYRVLWNRCFPGRSLLKSYLSLVLYKETKKRRFLAEWVDAYVTLSEFGRSKFIEAGLPKDKVFVKPNFIEDLANGASPGEWESKGALYAGRVSSEKGIETLLQAWHGLDYPVWVAGDGPLLKDMWRKAPASVQLLGWQPHNEIMRRLREAAIFVFPSEVYEGFPLSLLEAMALGKAIIASDLGPRREMIEDGISGLLFEAGNADDLRTKIEMLIRDHALRVRLGQAAREMYLTRYTPEKNYDILMSVYEHVLQS
jgi:glycosyltransferase involved in cell wall biosynthesis